MDRSQAAVVGQRTPGDSNLQPSLRTTVRRGTHLDKCEQLLLSITTASLSASLRQCDVLETTLGAKPISAVYYPGVLASH